MNISFGWKCPQCSAIWAPSVEKCSACASAKATWSGDAAGRPIYGAYGTVTMDGVSFSSGFGTVFYSPPKTEATRASEVVTKWQDDGNSVKVLARAAVDALVDDEGEEDEDE